ncbi:MAG: carbohydrate ABC transporter permease [Candidatus Brocadiia bacterium]|nr:MAG: carbohydrate ABC transporter permease [Candidatus Brocadiia bacterium]
MKKLLYYLGVVFVLFLVVFPFLWMVLASFKTQVEIMDMQKLVFFHPTIANYTQVFREYSFLEPLYNSFFIAVVSTFLSLLMGLPAAYSIARYHLTKWGVVLLITRIIPGLTFLVPWYIFFAKLRLIDTYTSLILTHLLVGLPLLCWVMVPYFETLPKSLEDSGRVDGCNNYQVFWHIVLPLCGPGIVTTMILAFIYSWNNFMFALALSGYRTKTLTVAIFNFIEYAQINWGGLMAASVLITFPVIAVSMLLQRYVVQGLTAGAVKG